MCLVGSLVPVQFRSQKCLWILRIRNVVAVPAVCRELRLTALGGGLAEFPFRMRGEELERSRWLPILRP